jgi:hypothetical protein
MKTTLILTLLVCNLIVLRAQDTIRTLIITEARIDAQHGAYLELTNVGADTLDLSNFEVGKISPWEKPYLPNSTTDYTMLPKKKLLPGKSFVLAKISDYCTHMWALKPDLFDRYQSKPAFLKLADMQIHVPEAMPPVSQKLDSISTAYNLFNIWGGSSCFYVRYHFMHPGNVKDSVVIDQVGGVFDESDGTNMDKAYDVAGVPGATHSCILIRKANVKRGNINFATGRGNNPENSEWIAVPMLKGEWEPTRAVFWTVGNSGDVHLSSLHSNNMTINWVDSTLTVPWGIRNDDSIMSQFTKLPGIAWHYDYSGNYKDSAFTSVRTGDKLTVYACGNEVEKYTFRIITQPSVSTDTKVIPKKVADKNRHYANSTTFCDVTENLSMDTIRYFPFGTRIDTLMRYLELPDNAAWRITFVDGIERADLKAGDILTVKSADRTNSKDYYIRPWYYWPSHEAKLSAITWPDIPDTYKGILGWQGDTIPGWSPTKYNYQVQIPFDVEGIPALVGIKAQVNAKLRMEKTTKLTCSGNRIIITFTNTAEDDTTTKVYKLELIRDDCGCLCQPWFGDPFISQYVFKQGYSNYFCEIVNPGTETLDLSNYMLTFGDYADANEAITRVSGASDFANRYNKYVPGYKWVDKATWASKPAYLEEDLNIFPIIGPGDVFVLADIFSPVNDLNYPKSAIPEIDLDFQHNPWGDTLKNFGQTMQQWTGQKIMLFKILNDSIKAGTKAANDPKDFQLIDVMGTTAGDAWVIGGTTLTMNTSWIRKPNVYKGNPVIQASFGTSKDNSEWINMLDGTYPYLPYPLPYSLTTGIGSHFMFDVTSYRSTVSSNVYRVSHGYSHSEGITGIGKNTTVTEFYNNIIKADTGQHLKVIKASDGTLLSGANVISQGDSLIVVSRDSTNTTMYLLDLTPISNDALLKSALYTIEVNGANGSVGGFPYGTLLKDVVANITIPAGATMIITDPQGAYQPLKYLGFDTVYRDVQVNDQIKLEVTAEDWVTKIVYTLKPDADSTDAFVTSNVYDIDQSIKLINEIPTGTSVETFLDNLMPAPGATMKLIDNRGVERTFGPIYMDDRLQVTSANKSKTVTYYLPVYFCTGPYYAVYLTSDVYTIDPINRWIIGSYDMTTRVDSFLSKLIPSQQNAGLKLYDKFGKEKTTTDYISLYDTVVLTFKTLCQFTIVKYSLSNIIYDSTIGVKKGDVSIFPNPSYGKVNISGLATGTRIYVYNLVGELIMEKVAGKPLETLSLEAVPKGIYFVKLVTNGQNTLSRKIIIE